MEENEITSPFVEDATTPDTGSTQPTAPAPKRKNWFRRHTKLCVAVVILAVIAAIVGGCLSLFASSNPDGLEWSLFGNVDAGYSQNMGLDEEDYGVRSGAADTAAAIQEKTAFLPDYAFSNSDSAAGTTVSGLVGSGMVAGFAALICMIGGFFRKKKTAKSA